MKQKVEEPEAVENTTKVSSAGSRELGRLATKVTTRKGSYLDRVRERAAKITDRSGQA